MRTRGVLREDAPNKGYLAAKRASATPASLPQAPRRRRCTAGGARSTRDRSGGKRPSSRAVPHRKPFAIRAPAQGSGDIRRAVATRRCRTNCIAETRAVLRRALARKAPSSRSAAARETPPRSCLRPRSQEYLVLRTRLFAPASLDRITTRCTLTSASAHARGRALRALASPRSRVRPGAARRAHADRPSTSVEWVCMIPP